MKKEKEGLGIYSLIYDKENKDWVIQRKHAERATKRCKTKEEAMKALKELSKNQDVGAVVHKKDGKKQKKK